MRKAAKSSWSWAVIASVLFLSVYMVFSLRAGETKAENLAGTISQSSSAIDNGITIEVERAMFSATSVDVWLWIDAPDSALTSLNIMPPDAELSGVAGTSAHVRVDGRTTVRFPASAWPDGPETTDLTIHAVQGAEGSHGKFERITGRWNLAIALPQGDEAEAARFVQALQPTVANVDGHEVLIEAFRTSSATIVRYELPGDMWSFFPPALIVDGGVLEGVPSQQSEKASEIWFDATPDNSSLILLLSGIVVLDPNASESRVEVAVAPFDPPLLAGPSRSEEHLLSWQVDGSPSDLAIQEIVWRRGLKDTRLRITVAGLWDPGLDGQPIVLGDGVELLVRGVGLYPPTSERGAQTIISVVLPDGVPPQRLVVDIAGASRILPTVEAMLQP